MPTDGEADPRIKNRILIPALHEGFYPWYCRAIRGSLRFVRVSSVFHPWLSYRSCLSPKIRELFMKPCASLLAFVAILGTVASQSPAAELPKVIAAAACLKPPTIDGVLGDDEWKDAQTIEFDMAVLNVKTQKLGKRDCTLRLMNSANGLYVALTVPDETANKTLSPVWFISTTPKLSGPTCSADSRRIWRRDRRMCRSLWSSMESFPQLARCCRKIG